jgi:hypothetical protein
MGMMNSFVISSKDNLKLIFILHDLRFNYLYYFIQFENST